MKKSLVIVMMLAFAAVLSADCGKCATPCESKDEAVTDIAAKADGCGESTDMDFTAMTKNEKLIYYTCPMEKCSSVHSDKAGECPHCGMEMVKGVVTSKKDMEFYGCPMESHSHVRSDKPGKCDECGMKLKPMRLAK